MLLATIRRLLNRRTALGLVVLTAAMLVTVASVLAFSYGSGARLYGIYSNSTSTNANPGGGVPLGTFNLRSSTQPNVLPGYYAGRFKGAIDGNIVYFYCIEVEKPINFPDNYAPSGRVSEKLGYILTNFYPNGSTAGRLTATEEAAAVQLAIWAFTDNLDTTKVYVTTSGFNSAQSIRIRNRATAIRNAANANAINHHVVNSLAFDTIGTTTNELGDPIEFRILARDQSGDPMSGVVVNFTTTSGTLSRTSATTGSNGYTPTVTLTGSNVGTATVTARTTRTNKVVGVAYYRTTGASSNQAVVLATPNTDTLSTPRTYTFTKASPSISTQASAATTVGTPIKDTATLSGGFNPTGTITFRLYGPAQTTCTGTPIFTSSVTVSGNKAYTSANYTPTQPGTYRWVATYNGDAKNLTATHACNAANENVVISKKSPTLNTQASPTVTLGNPIFDTATLAGGYNPTGTITFRVYGPDDATCATPIALYNGATGQSTVTVSGNGSYQSASYLPLLPGTYRWIANYSGDANNNAKNNACNGANESVIVTLTTPTLSTEASASVQVGGDISDTATLAGGLAPTGTITFNLYGPDDENCAEASIFTDEVAVDGNGDYQSGPFTTSLAGEYRWIASYSGDANNEPESGVCNGENENVVVTTFAPSLTTNASDDTIVGLPINDTATLAGGLTPTGTITFDLYGPDDEECVTSIFTDEVEVDGNGDYVSESFMPTDGGTYRWIADYSGDVNNDAVDNGCNEANENVSVRVPAPGEGLTLTTNASDDVLLGGEVSDIATLGGEPLLPPVGTITFNLYGPGDETCETSIYNEDVLVAELGDYESGSFIPTAAGVYYWIASYTPVGETEPALMGECGEVSETVTVSEIPPVVLTLTTNASDDVQVGGEIFDTATLSAPEEAVDVEGTIAFDLYGPDDETCETSVFHSEVVIVSTGVYESEHFTTTEAGTYYWIATFTPEGEETATLAGTCGEEDETVTVSVVPPSPSPTPTPTPTPKPLLPNTASGDETPISGTIPLLLLLLGASAATLSAGTVAVRSGEWLQKRR